MAKLPIVLHPNRILRKKTRDLPLEFLQNKDTQRFLDDMTETMIGAQGIGLAANQVGRDLNIAVISTEDGPLHLINPRIESYGKIKQSASEGCLSVPLVSASVRRSSSLKLRAYDRRGLPVEFSARDLFARVLQHEVDHLNGILCIDRADRIVKSERGKK